ncbi:MAG: flagellar basal body rod protein FlgC [Thermacetogeniaceae bacterium]
MEISGSGLTAQRLRMDIISNNIANAGTTRSGNIDANGRPLPYRREFPVFAAVAFNQLLQSAESNTASSAVPGVRVTAIAEDNSPFPMVYNPNHPDANAQGYVQMPNVNTAQEMVDMIDASRSYEANISALNASKEMCTHALDIGK